MAKPHYHCRVTGPQFHLFSHYCRRPLCKHLSHMYFGRFIVNPCARRILGHPLKDCLHRSIPRYLTCQLKFRRHCAVWHLYKCTALDSGPHGRTGLDVLEVTTGQDIHHPANLMARQVPDAHSAALYVKARRINILAAQGSPPGQAPTYLHSRVVQGKAWPCVGMANTMAARGGGGTNTGGDTEVEEQQQRLYTMMAFLLGFEGLKGKTSPGGLFVGIMDFLMPSWDPLRERTGLEIGGPNKVFLEDDLIS